MMGVALRLKRRLFSALYLFPPITQAQARARSPTLTAVDEYRVSEAQNYLSDARVLSSPVASASSEASESLAMLEFLVVARQSELLELEKPSQSERSLASKSLESLESTRGAVREAGLKEDIRMALSTKPPKREVCPALAGILATATKGDNWTAQDARIVQRAQK